MESVSEKQQVQTLPMSSCKVEYADIEGMVLMKIGYVSINLDTHSFILMHEVMRKAVARLVMNTEINIK